MTTEIKFPPAPEPGAVGKDEMPECATCEGEGLIDDPKPCLRCGYVGCHQIECPACRGAGRFAIAKSEAPQDLPAILKEQAAWPPTPKR